MLIRRHYLKRASQFLVSSFRESSAPASRALSGALQEENILKSSYKDIVVPNLTVPEYVWQNMDRWADKTAVVCGVTGRGFTYSQAERLSSNMAAALRHRLRRREGDSIAIMLPNIPEYPLVALAVLQAGCVVSGIGTNYTSHEVQRQLLLSDSKIVVTLASKVDLIKEAFKMAKLDLPIIVIKSPEESTPPGTIPFTELAEDFNIDKGCLKEVRRAANDVAFLPYSSGTTGLPKGVELEHRNVIANCEQINEELIKNHEDTTKTHQSSVMAVLPFFHIYGLSVVMLHKLSQGCKVVTVPSFQPDTFLDALVKHHVSLIYAAPPLVLFMATNPNVSEKHFEHLKTVVTGAAPLPVADVQRLFDKAKKEFYFVEGYGLTESSPVVSMTRKGEKSYGNIGYPIPNTYIKIIDAEGKALGPDQSGEMCVRGPQVMRGYRNNPEANKAVFTDGGWLRTGDMASYNHKGEITIRGRLKELIKVKGFQVPPAELESLLREHPDVADAAVVGAPHTAFGEVPRAFVVRKHPDVRADTLKRFVAERVASYKNIAYLQFVDAIPKNATGKIMRRDLENEPLPDK